MTRSTYLVVVVDTIAIGVFARDTTCFSCCLVGLFFFLPLLLAPLLLLLGLLPLVLDSFALNDPVLTRVVFVAHDICQASERDEAEG